MYLFFLCQRHSGARFFGVRNSKSCEILRHLWDICIDSSKFKTIWLFKIEIPFRGPIIFQYLIFDYRIPQKSVSLWAQNAKISSFFFFLFLHQGYRCLGAEWFPAVFFLFRGDWGGVPAGVWLVMYGFLGLNDSTPFPPSRGGFFT